MAFKKPCAPTHTYAYTEKATRLPGAVCKAGQKIKRLVEDKMTKLMVKKGYIVRVDND